MDRTVLEAFLTFMQKEDWNGAWLQWLDEIDAGEEVFDKDYAISVLNEWYESDPDIKYLNWIKRLETII